MTRSTVLFIAILVAIIQVCTAFYLPEGVYEVELGSLLLTGIDGIPNELAHLERKDGTLTQLWRLFHDDNERFTLRNEESGLYLSFDDEPEPSKFLTVSKKPARWTASSEGDRFFIETVEQYEGNPLLVDVSPLLIWPPRVILQLPRKTSDQTWSLRPVEYFEQPRQYRLSYKIAGRCH